MAAIFDKNLFLVSKTFGRKTVQKLFRHVSSACACAINGFGSHWHSAVLSQLPLCPFSAPSSSFVLVCNAASCLQVSDSLSQISSYRARLSALGQIISYSCAMMRRFLSIGFLSEKTSKVMCFSDLENCRRNMRNSLI